ncbi:response regulator transcription factor [Rhodobacteraceae bacterium D3-12]|nr:response regulator transcription factor [Rhodobacteraceae bacterium D3-12]
MRVLIADDHDLLRDTLVLFLQGQGNIETQIAADLDEACSIIEAEDAFDLVLLDYNMPGMNGLEGLTKAMSLKGGQRVALMSGQATRKVAEEALEAGAAGFVPKTLSAKSMVNAVRFMAMGEQYAPIDFMTATPDEPVNALAEKLSPRELQVLEGLTEGKSNKEIARDLDIQEPTVKLHMKTLYRKLGAANRTQAALIAREAGLFTDTLKDRFG